MSEPTRMEVLAASRGRFLRTPKVSDEAHEMLSKALNDRSGRITEAIKIGIPGVFQGLSLTIRLRWDLLDLARVEGLLPGHLQSIKRAQTGAATVHEVTLTGPVISLARAFDQVTTFPQLVWAFNKTIAEEFPEDSLLALQALIDRRKDANHETTERNSEGLQPGTGQVGEASSQA